MNRKLRIFNQHGIIFKTTSGETQVIANCPFCKAELHFYVNHITGCWDCKRCGLFGGYSKFLYEMSKLCTYQIDQERLNKLSEDRSIKRETLRRHKIGYNFLTHYYTLPVFNSKGCGDLRLYKIGEKIKASIDAKLELFNYLSILEDKKNKPIYICEGEWDFLVMDEIIHNLGIEGIAIGSPGAYTFKTEWVSLFKNRDVNIIYDNDEAGIRGERKIYENIKSICKSIKFLHWNGKKEGFDLRDLYKENNLEEERTYDILIKLFQNEPRKISSDEVVSKPEKKRDLKRIPAEKVVKRYMDWLHIPNPELVHLLFGTIIGNRLEGEPLWLFLVAPPGSTKSVLLMSLGSCDEIITTTSLTPRALISGFFSSHGDPSLIPKLNKKVLVIKDFTTVLNLPIQFREEIFGILRDAYDGHTEKIFGNGVLRAYDSKFGMICGVTPAVDIFSETHASLGERFLKYRYSYQDWYPVIKRAINNTHKENEMKKELNNLAEKILSYDYTKSVPNLPETIQEELIYLAQWTAILRGSVSRDKYTQEIIFRPSPEIGTRLVKQFSKLMIGLYLFRGQDLFSHEDICLIRKVARSTISEKNESIFMFMYKLDKNKIWDVHSISQEVKLPTSTCMKILQDLNMLKVLKKIKIDKNIYGFTFEKDILELTEKAKVYDI